MNRPKRKMNLKNENFQMHSFKTIQYIANTGLFAKNIKNIQLNFK